METLNGLAVETIPSILRGRPPGRAAGNIGAISAQAASVKSVS
jgi:hypothetical protein